MKGVDCNVKTCMDFDGEIRCCDCDCAAGRGHQDSKDNKKKHVVCIYICSFMIKIDALLHNFMADDSYHELVAHLAKKKTHNAYGANKIESMTLSLITLSSTALASRREKRLHH